VNESIEGVCSVVDDADGLLVAVVELSLVRVMLLDRDTYGLRENEVGCEVELDPVIDGVCVRDPLRVLNAVIEGTG